MLLHMLLSVPILHDMAFDPVSSKIACLIAIIWVVWTVFRIYETRQAAIRAQQARDGDEARHDAPHGAAGRDSSDADHSVDLRECKSCGAWVSGENCGQENCPYCGFDLLSLTFAARLRR